jgi:hypothetical protein
MKRRWVTTMDTPQEHNDMDTPKTDPELDALLDEALSVGTPPAHPDLAQRIIKQTFPLLGQRSVLARIGPTVLRVAAAVAIVVGAAVAATIMSTNKTPVEDAPGAFAQIESGLQDINDSVELGNTLIDEQLDVLALRVELASADDTWGTSGTDTNSLIEQAVTDLEVERFGDDTLFLLADTSTLF